MNRLAGPMTGVLALGLMLAGSVLAGDAGKDDHGAAWPKGHYAALDKLPDWGGVWVLNFGRPPGAGAPEQPQLKGQPISRLIRASSSKLAPKFCLNEPLFFCVKVKNFCI